MHADKKNATELSKHMWDLRDRRMEGKIKWEIAKRSTPYKCGTRRCDLCLSEKLLIASAEPSKLLNKRSELISACRHKSKYRMNKQSPTTPGAAAL